MRFARTALGVCVALLAGTAALAQMAGGIEVKVTDQDGQPLPGATVTISHELGYVKTTTDLTNKHGIVAFPVLKPDPLKGYSIQIDFPGFSPIRLDGIQVKASSTTPVPVQMIEAYEEKVTVRAKTPTLDLDKQESSTRFSDDFIADLPVPGRFYQNVLPLAPGVQDVDGDGNPNVHGSRERDFQMLVGGVSNVDPLTGQYFSNINANSIEEMEVITSGAGVEFGRAQGGFGQIIQKQGSNSHEGIVEFYWRTSKLDGDGANDESDLPAPDYDTIQPGFQFSGPLIKDKLWYRVSYELIDTEDPVNTTSDIVIVDEKQETRDGQVTWQVSPRNKLALNYRSDPSQVSNFGVSSAVGPESSLAFDRKVSNWATTWTAPYSPKVLVDTTLGWQDISITTSPSTFGVFNNCVPNADETFLNQSYCTDITNNQVSGSWPQIYDDHRQRLSVKGRATIYGGQFWGMTHQFKMGLNIENERFFRSLTLSPRSDYVVVDLSQDNDDGSTPNEDEDEPDLESFGLITSELFVPSSDEVRATGTNWAVYAEDQFKPRQNLTITLGVRVDREEINSEGRAPFDPAAELAAFTEYVNAGASPQDKINRQAEWPLFFTGYEDLGLFGDELAGLICAGLTGNEKENCETNAVGSVLDQSPETLENLRKASNINITNTNFSPSLALAWSPWSNNKTLVKAAMGRHYNNIPLTIPIQEINPVSTSVQYRASLTDPDACPPPNPDDPNPPAVACGKTQVVGGISPLLTVSTVDRGLKTPYQDEFSLKVERELWAETSISVEYINRRFRDQIQDINLNLAADDLGRCQRQTATNPATIATSPGTSSMSCSTTPVVCQDASDCPAGESCGFYFNAANDWLIDPFTGIVYPDTNPGDGDGFMDPMTGSTDDNCVGDVEVEVATGDEPCEPPFCDNAVLLVRPDEITDLYLQNPFWGDVYLIGNFNEIDYEGIVVELVRRLYRSWEMNASYTWSEAKGDGEDFFQELGDDPTLKDNIFGFQSYDQTHVVKVNATTVTPWGVRLGTAVIWQSGLPYSILIREFSFDSQAPITEAFGGEGARRRLTYPTGVRNDQRNPSSWLVNLKATKELKLGKGMNLQLSAEVFNVLDDDTYSVYNADFRRGQQFNGINEATRNFGRRWQMGMKLSF